MEVDNLNNLIIHATLGDLIEAMKEGLGLSATEYIETYDSNICHRNYVYGMKGLAKLLGCSLSTANRIKKSGILAPAISQRGKIVIIDADLAIDLLKVRKRRR